MALLDEVNITEIRADGDGISATANLSLSSSLDYLLEVEIEVNDPETSVRELRQIALRKFQARAKEFLADIEKMLEK